ncbi:7-cyano-7-deazaguanine synthase [Rhizomicrobium palustre]|uniref:7-cyano-7-deazaguanine synthase n=1 Tax=Rhizomicrobium palustre TaxID=189966 RepID=A0A846N4X1_9PROT|nr:7-cyano-7-deazaguanine synthase QueC [Rhizomicrobium palustre]NIK90127.1 7-cyano-7-deazaguanine synthase [Rhizomicrobium palustre]
MMSDSALVLFSGGQDSTTCLAWALARFARVETIGFDYGQRHRVELEARQRVLSAIKAGFPEWAPRLGEDHLFSLDVLKQIGGSALTDNMTIEMGQNGLPTSFVPGRNVLFLTTAAALAYRRGISDLVGGMCETDFSGYPDCREKTVQACAVALTMALDRPVTVHTPLMWIDKAETWALADELGGTALIDLIREETVTCYEGDREHHHDWGYGCGVCPACDLRAKGYAKYRAHES